MFESLYSKLRKEKLGGDSTREREGRGAYMRARKLLKEAFLSTWKIWVVCLSKASRRTVKSKAIIAENLRSPSVLRSQNPIGFLLLWKKQWWEVRISKINQKSVGCLRQLHIFMIAGWPKHTTHSLLRDGNVPIGPQTSTQLAAI